MIYCVMTLVEFKNTEYHEKYYMNEIKLPMQPFEYNYDMWLVCN